VRNARPDAPVASPPGTGIFAGFPFAARRELTGGRRAPTEVGTRRPRGIAALRTAFAVGSGATNPVSFDDRRETFSTPALRILPKFKLLQPR